MNWSNNHYDLDFGLTVCDITGWPYRGHEAASEYTMLKKGRRGVRVPLALVWGRRVHQLLGQVEEGGPRPCGVEETFSWSMEMIEFLSYWLKGARTLAQSAWLIERGTRAQSCLVDWKGCALKVAWLIERGAHKVRGLVIFLLLPIAAKSWWRQIPSRSYRWLISFSYLSATCWCMVS